MAGESAQLPASERAVVLLIAAIQFINILDFMIVMPLGPEFARELDIGSNNIGFIAGSYTMAAAVSGVACAFFLDRFDRRKALAVAMLGLVTGTALCGLSWDLLSLVGARVIAGLFGGPATALSLAIVADVVPPQRRGRAMAAVMMSFSVASIFGVPMALEIANAWGWHMPFFVVAGLGLAVAAAAVFLLPPMRLHLMRGVSPPGAAMFRMISKPLPLLAYGSMMAMMFSAFTIIPNIPTYLIFNVGYTGEAWLPGALSGLGIEYTPSVLGPLYLIGGVGSLIVMQFVGRLTDRVGSGTVSWIGALLTIAVIYFWFIDYSPAVPTMLLFLCFMSAMSVRGVPARALDTKIPLPHERAAFMSMQSAVQHTSLALAAGLSSIVLTENPDRSLNGVPLMAIIAVVFAVLLPVFVTLAEKGLQRRDLRSAQPAVSPTTAAASPPIAAGAGTDS
jgi:predicted MFS family arabinose efflux permease